MPQASRGSGLEDVEPTPGPGAYDTGGTLESVDHGVSFKGTAAERDGVRGDRSRGREADQIPGSGSYDVGGGGDASRVSTARGGRVSVKSAAMGYEMQRPADATESYLMSVPGPGEYDTQGITRLGLEQAAHVPVIGTEPRNTSGVARDSWALPGPGSHDTVGRHHEWFVGGGGGVGMGMGHIDTSTRTHAHHTYSHTHGRGCKTGREGFGFGREAQRVPEPALVEVILDMRVHIDIDKDIDKDICIYIGVRKAGARHIRGAGDYGASCPGLAWHFYGTASGMCVHACVRACTCKSLVSVY